MQRLQYPTTRWLINQLSGFFSASLPMLRGGALGLLLAVSSAQADEPCKLVFDMGSSGIRMGSNQNGAIERIELDALGHLQGAGSAVTLDRTTQALVDLPQRLGLPENCLRVAGGFSAWRQALQRNPDALISQLAAIQRATGVALLVIPQEREGHYGYLGAKAALGQGSAAITHVLDLGGGSVQVSREAESYGLEWGQKSWRRQLCIWLNQADEAQCETTPLPIETQLQARQTLHAALDAAHPVAQQNMHWLTLSKPISKSIVPALLRLGISHPNSPQSTTITRQQLQRLIERLAPLTLPDIVAVTGVAPQFARFLVSDSLLLEGILSQADQDELLVLNAELTNIPGLLADTQAFQWQGHYACYLAQLAQSGPALIQQSPEQRCRP